MLKHLLKDIGFQALKPWMGIKPYVGTSGKHVRAMNTPLYPTLWGMHGYTYFFYFCSKT